MTIFISYYLNPSQGLSAHLGAMVKEKFEDTKRVIICRYLKDKQYKWTKEKGQTMIDKIVQGNLNTEQHEPF